VPREWFVAQLDYIFFWYGLAFLLLAAACFQAARRAGAGRLPWLWLALFGLTHGINEWLDMLALDLPDPMAFKLGRTAVMAVSYMALFDFGRRGWKAYGCRAPGRWVFVPLLVLSGLGWLGGPQGLNAACRYSLGFTGAVLSAFVLRHAAISANANEKTGLWLASAAMFVYAGAMGLVTPGAPFWPADWLNHDSFLAAAGFPIQMLRALCALACMAGVWLHGRAASTEEDRDGLTGRWVLPSALVLLIALGWMGTDWRGRVADDAMRQESLRQASGIARTIDQEHVRELSFTADDKTRPEFQSIREQMIAYGLFAGQRCIYSVAERNGAFVFGPENLDEKDPLASPPGTVYEHPSPDLSEVFRTMQRLSVGPYKDEYGTFVSGFAPVVDKHFGEVLLSVGVDIMGEQWRAAVSSERLRAILLTLVLTVVLLSGLSLLEWRRWFPKEKQRWWFHRAESLLIAALGLVLTVILTMTANDLEKRRNREDFNRLADAQAQIIGETFRDIRRELSDLARFFRGGKQVLNREFEAFAGPVARSSCVQALGWVSVVSEDEKDAFEAEMCQRQQGFGAFSVYERTAAGERIQAAERREYYPLTFVTPFQENEVAVGYDQGSEPIRRETLERAIRTRLPAATPPVQLVHETGREKGVLAYYPVFGEGKDRPFGFVLCVLRLETALKRTLAAGGGADPHIAVVLVDVTSQGELNPLAEYPERPDGRASPVLSAWEAYRSVHPLFILGRSWAIVARPGPAFVRAHQGWVGPLTGLTGLLVTMVMTVFVGFLNSRQATLERKVLERTRALSESEADLSITLHSIGDAVIVTDTEGRITRMNPAAALLTGWPPEEASGKVVDDVFRIINAQTRDGVSCPVQQVLATGRTVEPVNDTTLVARDGCEYQVADSAAPIRDYDGQIQGAVLVFHDVSEQYRTKETLRESEERLRLVLDATSEGLWDWDIRTGVVHFSPQWIRQLGYSPEDVPPSIKSMLSLIHPEDLPRVREVLQAHFDGGTALFECQDRLLMKSGKYRHNLHRGKVVERDADGNPLRIVGADSDITERIRSERALRSSKQEVETIIDSLQNGLMIIDAETHAIIEANPAACKMIGLPRGDVVGHRCHRFVCPAQAGACPITDMGQPVDNSDRILLTADSRAVPILKTVIPIALGERRCLLESFVDITERKRSEDALRSTMAELEVTNLQLEEAIARANEMAALAEMASIAKSQFLANMSHEIRTPMNGVIGMTGLLLDTDLTPEQRQYAEIVRSSGDNLLSLINNILDFSKIEAGKLELETLDFDLRTTMEDIVEMLAVKAHEKGLELTCMVEPEVPSLLRGDPGRLRQIVVNLAGNAMKFTHEGEVAIRIGLERATDTHVTPRFAIRDTGIGIPAERQSILFTMFSQVDGSTTRKYGGTGLGLAISKQLAEKMGGRIGVESEQGKGSTFWFTAEFARQPDAKSGATPSYAEIAGLRVLVVDDHETNRLLVNTLLLSWGCRPAEAEDGQTALHMLEDGVRRGDPFHAALIDYQMPEMDGVELGRRIAENPEIGGTRLILMSSLGQGADTTHLTTDRFAACLTKPLRQAHLRECLALAMGHGGSEDRGTRRTIATRQPVVGPDRRNVRILLAEDNPTNQKVARVVLEKFGFRVDVASNGQEAVEALILIPYDLVLMDCQMPEMDGFEATRLIRGGGRCLNPRVPIVAMTANAMRGDRERCIEAGMDDYIAKPVQPRELAELIDRLLSRVPKDEGVRDRSSGESPPVIPADGEVFRERDLLERLMDDRDLAREIVAGFLDDLPRQVARLRDFIDAHDAAGAHRQAHTIKGAAGNVGAPAIRALAVELEEMGKAGRFDEVLKMLPLLDAELEKLRIDLEQKSWI